MDPILTGEDEYKDRDLVPNTGPYLAGDFGPVPVISPEYHQSVAGSSVSLGSGTTMDSPRLDQAVPELPKKSTYTNVGKYSSANDNTSSPAHTASSTPALIKHSDRNPY